MLDQHGLNALAEQIVAAEQQVNHGGRERDFLILNRNQDIFDGMRQMADLLKMQDVGRSFQGVNDAQNFFEQIRLLGRFF